MEIILAAIVGVILGVVIGQLVSRGKQHELITKAEVLQSQLDGAKSQSDVVVANMQKQIDAAKADARMQIDTMKIEAQNRLDAAKKEWNQLLADSKTDADSHCQQVLADKEKSCAEAIVAKEKACNDKIESQERRHNEAIKAQQIRFDDTLAKVTAQLKTATDEMLRQRQKEFAESSNTNLGQIVNPLRETIDKMKQAMDKSTMQQTAMTSTMKAKIEDLMHHSEAAQKSAEDLADALKHKSKVQGDWGEIVLSELLEGHGLTKGIQFDVQDSIRDASGNVIKSDEGSIMRPDVILHLDQRREVIIDSKVSLSAFIDYVNAETEEDRQKFLKAHVDSIQKHVKELSVKDYSSYIQPPKVKMDYVIMFVPHTGALWTAINEQPDLWRKAMEQNVFIADEQTMFAALRIINLTWTQIVQAQNHEQVFALANEMLDRVGQFVKKYQAIGKAIDGAQKAYEDGEKKLDVKGQSILQTCAKLQKLGAKQSNKNPLPQIESMEDNQE